MQNYDAIVIRGGNALHHKSISTSVKGLYLVGISGQRSLASATLRDVREDAAYVLRHLKQDLKQQGIRKNESRCLQPNLRAS